MKKVLLLPTIFITGLLVLWIVFVFPYPSCTKKQIEIMKHDLIEGILQREIKLRELYAKAKGKEFIQTKAFKQQLQREKEKFYKLCNNDGASEYKNRYCEITTDMSIFSVDRYSTYTMKYRFDKESKAFFNQVTTFWGHRKSYSNPAGKKKIPHDEYWIAFDDASSVLLYPTRVVGYSSEAHYFNCSDHKDSYLTGVAELELTNSKAAMKKDLTPISSFVPTETDASSGAGHDIGIAIKTYIQIDESLLTTIRVRN